ncbi:MAG: hypothetical protein K8R13_08045 [Methanococcoides sp.]|nr:hypothetical protein [Methanococcoides sp.]
MTSEDVSIIKAIKTPLGFFSLIVLVMQSVLGGLALTLSGTDRTFLLYANTGIFILLILLIAAISAFRPEALWGKRYIDLEESFAVGLGEELFNALDGSLDNLKETDREEAFRQLNGMITSTQHAHSRKSKKFAKILAESTIRRAKLKLEWQKTMGTIEKS